MEKLCGLESTGCKELDMTERLHFHFIFLELSCGVACIVLGLILCPLLHLLLFSPILKARLSFHLAYSFLCCAEAFNFN